MIGYLIQQKETSYYDNFSYSEIQMCGLRAENEYMCLTSTNTIFGTPDLDLRPAEMKRSEVDIMKKIRLLVMLFSIVVFFSSSISAYAAPKTMSDGQLFDAEFYANTYPDVKAAYGYDEALLYAHYLAFGKAEGRLPYAEATVVTVPATNDLIIGNKDETAEKQAVLQSGYAALPQNVKNFFNKKNIRIYAATRDYIGTVNTRKSLGYTYFTFSDTGAFISADVYVCGSTNSFMPPVYTLYHERGHILDSSSGWKAYSSNWSGWEEMKPYSPTQVYNEGEAFAEAFAAYFLRPEKLQKTAPNAYLYIESIIINML